MKFFRKVPLGLCPQTDFYSSRRQDDIERPVIGAKSGARSDGHGRTLAVIRRRVNGWKDCLAAPKRPDGFPPPDLPVGSVMQQQTGGKRLMSDVEVVMAVALKPTLLCDPR